MKIVTPLEIRYDGDEKYPFILIRDFVCDIDGFGRVTVPNGFRTDFASVPVGFRWLVPVVGRFGWASVVHDWLYSCPAIERREADMVFRRALLALQIRPWRRFLLWMGVRLFGWIRYRRVQERSR